MDEKEKDNRREFYNERLNDVLKIVLGLMITKCSDETDPCVNLNNYIMELQNLNSTFEAILAGVEVDEQMQIEAEDQIDRAIAIAEKAIKKLSELLKQ